MRWGKLPTNFYDCFFLSPFFIVFIENCLRHYAAENCCMYLESV